MSKRFRLPSRTAGGPSVTDFVSQAVSASGIAKAARIVGRVGMRGALVCGVDLALASDLIVGVLIP